MGRAWSSLGVVFCVMAAACGVEPVGAPCVPEQTPAGGFDGRESYVEVGSLQCETRTCLVHRFEGDLDTPGFEDSVYCTCRCDARGDTAEECACPEGFVCQEVLSQGGPGVRGSYCVKR